MFVVGGLVWYFVYTRNKADKQGILSQYILDRSDEMLATAVSAASTVQPDGGGGYRVMIPLANPRTEKDLITLASTIAKQRGGTVDAVHIVTAPDQTSLQYAADHIENLEEDYHALLDEAKRDTETFGVDVETHTILSHRLFEEIFDAARGHRADFVVMNWEDDTHGSPGRVESALDELTDGLPCDFLVMKDRGFEPERILVPTAGGPDSDLGAEVAKLLWSEYGSRVTLLHVADSHDEGRGVPRSVGRKARPRRRRAPRRNWRCRVSDRAGGDRQFDGDYRGDRTGIVLPTDSWQSGLGRRRRRRVFRTARRTTSGARGSRQTDW